MHLVYKEGYWVNADDIIFIMSALLGDIGLYAPTAYNLVAGALKKAVSKERAPSKTTRSSDKRWGKWTIQVTNCGGSGSSGTHWVLTATKFDMPPQAIVWEPLSTTDASGHVVDALRTVCDEVPYHIMGHQTDGWSCGYIVVWWILHQHSLLVQDGAFKHPPKPPVGWNETVWLMLEARDAQKGNDRSTPFDLGLEPLLQQAWAGAVDNFIGSVQSRLRSKLRKG